jgi:hypothetical protein
VKIALAPGRFSSIPARICSISTLSMATSSSVSSRHAERINAVLLQHVDASIGLPSAPEDADRDVIARSGVILLGRKPEFPEREMMGMLLAADQRYYRHLIEPELLSAEHCYIAAATLCHADTAFVVGLIRAADDAIDLNSVMRAIEIIEKVDKTMVAAQWIRRQTGHADPLIRSKAVKMLSRVHVNLLFIERQLGSKDARVRANAVEGLWGVSSHGSRQLLEKAAADEHHRVAANGLIGLCLADAPGAVQRMIQAANAESPQLRAAVAWAMGQTGRAEFTDEIKKLAEDEEAVVRECAARVINSRKGVAAPA